MKVDPRAKAWLLRLYEIPLLAVVAWLAYKWRMLSYEPIVTENHVYFIGTDPYYHWRVILATVANFPQTLRFDPFTHFPNGTGTGQFGSLFDVGAAALAIALGKTDRIGVAEVTAMYPAILGAILFIPFYFLARRLVGRIGALFATITLLLMPGEFLVRSLAGYADHHVAEALGMILAVLGAFTAVEVAAARADRLRWPKGPEDWRALAWPLTTVTLGALAVVFYFLVWPPAILVVGIFGIFLAAYMAYDHARGADTTYLAFAGGGVFLLAGAILLPTAESPRLNFNTFSMLQPVACLLLGGGIVALHFVSDALRARAVHRAVLPVGGATFGLVGFFSLQWFAPGLYGALKWGASWVTGIGVQREILTIAEAQPSSWETLQGEYGFTIVAFVFTLFALAAVILWKRRRADLLLLVWSLLMYQAARTQVRFNYYLALVVALAIGWLAYQAAELTGLNRALASLFGSGTTAADAKPTRGTRGRRARAPESRAEFKWHQPLAVGLIALLVLPGLVIPAKADDGTPATECSARLTREEPRPAWVLGSCFGGPDGNLFLWVQALDWMRENTPDPGVAITQTYDPPAAGERFDYPEEAYGVLSWWDYGHWIQVEGERPPVANPFQQAAPFASCFFTAQNESRANALLDAWRAYDFQRASNDVPCDAVVTAEVTGDVPNPVRYVMIDDEMAAGKYGAIAVWAKFNGFAGEGDRRGFQSEDGSSVDVHFNGDGYYRSMLSRLYVDDAEGLAHWRVVHETTTGSLIGSVVRIEGDNARIVRFNDLLNRGEREVDDYRDWDASRNRLIPIGGDEYIYDAKLTGAVKTFERVDGALVEGENAPAGATVELQVPLKSDTTGREWVWSTTTTADASGRFSVRVPYATTDYLDAAAGGTTLTVKATRDAVVFAGGVGADVAIPDSAVLEGDVVRVTLA